MDKRSRNWCFTLNNHTDYDLAYLKMELECSYLVVGEEVGEQGTKHLQGYVEFKNGKTLSAVKKILKNTKYHLEPRMGTVQQAAQYCKKDGNFFEKGESSHQGARTDLDEIVLCVNSGTFHSSDFPTTFIKYHKGIEAYALSLHSDRSEKPYVEWRWGSTGTGKTRGAVEAHGYENTYIKDGTTWWNGYTQQTCIVIDDFDGKWPFRDLLRLLDHYPYQGQYKGGYVKINSPFITITAEYPPSHYYLVESELAQIMRRVNIVSNIKKIEDPLEI